MSVCSSLLLASLRQSIRFWAVVIIFAVSSFAPEASAQSGRRTLAQPTASPTPALTTPTEAANANAAKPPVINQPQARVKLLFAKQLTSKHHANEDVIAASFFKRLTDFLNVDCTSIGDLKQAQARARAKVERDAFVVLLKFDINSFQSGTIILNSPDLEIEYLAFAPRSGKKHVQGKIFFQTIGGGRMQRSSWPSGTPIRITPEAAGIEAAETLHHLLLVKNLVKQHP